MVNSKPLKFSILCLPDDIAKNATVHNWKDLYKEYMVLEVMKKDKKGNWTPEIDHYEYVWTPAVMERFIESIVKSIKKNVRVKRANKRNK